MRSSRAVMEDPFRRARNARDLIRIYARETGAKVCEEDLLDELEAYKQEKGGARMLATGDVEYVQESFQDEKRRAKQEKEGARMLGTGDVEKYRAKQAKLKARANEMNDVRAQNARLTNRVIELEDRLVALTNILEERMSHMAEEIRLAHGNHQLEARVMRMEHASAAEAYLKPPKPCNPPVNPDADPSAPNFIIYGGGRVEVLNGGQEGGAEARIDPVVGSPIQERHSNERFG